MKKGLTLEEVISLGGKPVVPKYFMEALTLEELRALGARPIVPEKKQPVEKPVDRVEKVIEKRVEVVKEADNTKVQQLEEQFAKGMEEMQKTIEAIRNEIKRMDDNNTPVSAGVSPLMILSGGNLISGQTPRINFIGATVANRNDGGVNVTFSGGGFTILAATGAKDDSNVTYTFTQAPSAIVQNGQILRDGAGYTLAGTTATMSNPTGTGGDIYGIA